MGASQIGVERIEDFVLTVSKNHYYRCYSNGGQPIFVYEGHKFIVPILWLAQSKNYISYPINLVYFDRHHDALVEGKRKEIASDIKKAKTFDEVFEIVADRLNTNNNTWLRLLMDLEIVKDAVMIGDSKYAHNDWNELEKFTDLKGNKHSLENIPQLEGAFNSQGNLDDIANRVFQVRFVALCYYYAISHRFRPHRHTIRLPLDLRKPLHADNLQPIPSEPCMPLGCQFAGYAV